jgi:NADH dehydrogenase [ubiquinone] 1 alpha subcomplex assembly factor 7
MTPLERLLIRQIGVNGPIPISDYMSQCLLHPKYGYYTTRQPFGAAGDFITAPEISQMFGELVGLCLAQSWLDQGSPSRFVLAELGPGRGTLMADLLRATRGVPGFHAAAEVTLVEASPALRQVQRQALGDHPIRWVQNLAEAADAPLFLIANEFFDALPVRQFIRDKSMWRETVVGVHEGHLTLGTTDPAPIAELTQRLTDTGQGEIVEICPQAGPILADLAHRIANTGGVALILDYGNWGSRGDTLQAVREHQYVPVLSSPGQADLTAHVDFAALARASSPCKVCYTTQSAFLFALGIQGRSDRLAASLSGTGLTSHLAALQRLTAPAEMGTLFKAFAIHAPGSLPPPGFD